MKGLLEGECNEQSLRNLINVTFIRPIPAQSAQVPACLIAPRHTLLLDTAGLDCDRCYRWNCGLDWSERRDDDDDEPPPGDQVTPDYGRNVDGSIRSGPPPYAGDLHQGEAAYGTTQQRPKKRRATWPACQALYGEPPVHNNSSMVRAGV